MTQSMLNSKIRTMTAANAKIVKEMALFQANVQILNQEMELRSELARLQDYRSRHLGGELADEARECVVT